MTDPQTKAQITRAINCHQCWAEGQCQLEFTYNENGRIVDAQVQALPQGWTYRPLGEGAGQAPLCPACQAG